MSPPIETPVENSQAESAPNTAGKPAARKRRTDDELFRSDVAAILIGVITFAIVVYAIFIIKTSTSQEIQNLILAHPAHSIGIPAAALIALFLVIFLEYTSGESLKFKGMGLQVEGAAGPVLFWVLCFTAVTLAIQLFRWIPGK